MPHLPDHLSVHFPLIDQRHAEFWELYTRLKNAQAEEFLHCFQEMIAQTRIHFAEEEADMLTTLYPNIKEHCQEHQKALEEMTYFYNKAKDGKKIFAVAYVNDRLEDWFKTHLLNMDSDLARVLKLSQSSC